jgi:hypothetical protein
MMMMIMGHECIWGTVWADQRGEEVKEGILRGKEDRGMG